MKAESWRPTKKEAVIALDLEYGDSEDNLPCNYLNFNEKFGGVLASLSKKIIRGTNIPLTEDLWRALLLACRPSYEVDLKEMANMEQMLKVKNFILEYIKLGLRPTRPKDLYKAAANRSKGKVK